MKNILILIIATLGIMNYAQPMEVITDDNVISKTDEMEIQQFNEKFTQYEGDRVRGATVNSLIQSVVANNMATDDESRKVSVNGAITLDKNDTELPEKRANAKHMYKVMFTYGNIGTSKGLVTSITIEELE